MTARTETVLTCDRETRPPVHGMRMICGEEWRDRGPIDATRQRAAREGWAHRGQQDYCEQHA